MRTIGLIVYPGFSAMSLAVTAVFETANLHVGTPEYKLTLLSERGGPVATSIGYEIQTVPFGRRAFDTLLVGGDTDGSPGPPGVARYLRAAARRTRRIAGVCTGAFVLAEAGLLDGRRATTHWYFAPGLQRKHPSVAVDDDRIFIVDGPIWTSAGMSAGIDLALALVEADLGVEVARMVARKLVVYHRRAGGQSQFSALLDLDARSDRVQTALTYAREHLSADLSVEQLARAAHLSPRQFSRVFREETGQSPAKAVERLRVEAARIMMESGRFSIDEVARENGFGNRERMRRSFVRAFGQPPQALRRAAGQLDGRS
ncbi:MULTISPECIES: GlxA family transcriptional regulator [Sorangium]|uniref:AraC family transcriptional regulator n=1 Tax=Sorangium cellulosum TaxID=56 RepID=A0A4P2QVS3_SORCE|nr:MULTISPECIES: GlxA family transcriptional regulator [Sorangium]AUX34211.1 AraC family transcriptional regulator [Sorangium cellulosum]WCQ93526.1 HTH-type transcriptional regulator CdhR [Sorangium sp. Soce836]